MTLLAVVAAHRTGLPLHHELVALGAVPVRCAWTAPVYRLVALAGPGVRRGGLVAVVAGGAAVEVELHELPAVALVALRLPEPLTLGPVELTDGPVTGIVCTTAPPGAVDVTEHGSWPAYLAARAERTALSLRHTH